MSTSVKYHHTSCNYQPVIGGIMAVLIINYMILWVTCESST